MTSPPKIESAADSQQVHVNLAERSYDIVIASNQLNSVASEVGEWLTKRLGSETTRRSVLVVTYRNVAAHADVVAGSFSAADWTV